VVPVALVAVLAAAGVSGYLVLDARADRATERDRVAHYVDAWGRQDFAAMHADLDEASQKRIGEKRFAAFNREQLDTATTRKLVPGEIVREDDRFTVPVTVDTRMFGTLKGTVELRITGKGDQARIAWARRMAFPGLRDGETLSRTTEMPPRGTILARDGKTVLAEGPDRTSTVPNIASQVVGVVDSPRPEDEALLRRLGVPSDAKVGISGLERILNPQLVGTPGGELKAGERTLKQVEPKQAKAVRSSISIAVVKAAVEAQTGAPDITGTTVIDARTGEVLGFQGSAWSALQPPGSTMKIVTAAAALEDGIATVDTVYPKETEAKGYGIQNSNEEVCGGTLVESFAHSCNSVFVPLGDKIGAKRFVEMAEKFGFNQTPPVLGAQRSTLPSAGEMAEGEVVTSAIGQARVQATSLQIALITATIANGGKQPELTFVQSSEPAKTKRVIKPSTAAAMRRMMVATIENGTGRDAKVGIAGITTGGKTGTAELAATQGAHCDEEAARRAEAPEELTDSPEPASPCGNLDGKSTTAWMAAYAPVTRTSGKDPIAIGVLRARNFQGGSTAAPVAKSVLTAALGG
jgi:peptidoglycan glycosyltransferase